MTCLNFLLTSLLFEAISFVPVTEQAASFISTPSSPSDVEENDNITLQWTYTLDGTPLDEVEIIFTPDSPSLSLQRVARYRSGGTIQVPNDFQDRFFFSLTDSQSTMTIVLSQRLDSGMYEVTVSPDDVNLAPIRDEVKISVKYAAKINYTSGNQTLNESDTLHLTCVADGNPTPNITWTRVSDNKAVPETLIISGKQDEGGYKCNASNGFGSPDSRIVHVFVQYYRPVYTTVTTNLTNNTVLVNETFSITCSAQANPPAKYQFYKGNEYISGADNNAVIITAVPERVKMVNYSCIPVNSRGNGTQGAVAVTVHYSPTGTKLTSDLTNTSVAKVLRGSSLKLKCTADANPMVYTYLLYFNGYQIGNSSQGVFHVAVQADGVCTCVPWNTIGSGDNINITITVVDPPSVTIYKQEVTVVEGHNTSLACNVSGKPYPTITWTKRGSSLVLSNTSSLDLYNVSRHDATDDIIQYNCTASNGVGTPATAMVNITVHYAPDGAKLISVPSNTTVLRKSPLNLTCQADASPEAKFHLYFNGRLKRANSSGIFNVTVMSDGVYTCVPSNKYGDGKNASVIVTTVEAPSVSVLPEAIPIRDGNSLNLTCNASGKPEAGIKWTMVDNSEVLSTDSRLTVNVSRQSAKKNMIQYQCTASNGVGTPATATVNVTVHYPAMLSDPKNATVNVTVGKKVPLLCRGEGYPTPMINLTEIYINGSQRNRLSGESNLTIVAEISFWFQCTVENYLAKQTKWFHLVLYVTEIEITITIVNKACSDNLEEIIKQLRKLVTDILKKWNIPVVEVKSLTFRCGSVKVYFSLTFSQNVELENVLTILMKAAVEKKFGDLQVDPNSIQAISPERIPKTTTPTLAPTPTNGDEGSSEVSKGLIFGLAASGVILLFGTFAGVIYCFYKRRKCRKDPRVHNSRSEERPCSLSQNDYCQVNNGYAEAGPQSTKVANLDHHQGEEGAAAVPNYAVVVKSKKKDKKKEKKGAEMNPCEDEYAVVDKSKKKTKKNEPDATYAEVDLVKKSKKPKPGEVLYADLGEFHHMKKMPEISTSPKTLPPIKRPDPYAETQYADITQFLKGNPGDAGAEPPKDSTTTAVGKEESLAGNTGDGAEGTNETGF